MSNITRIATHSGYCSGDVNEPTVETCTLVKPLPIGASVKIGSIVTKEALGWFDLDEILPTPDVEGDSYYCDPCHCWDDVERHDYAHSLVAAVAIDQVFMAE